jgi:hypothetical protein
MNCIDLRRDALAHPLRLAPEAQAHVDQCPACRAFVERQRELDAELYDTLRVPVPDGLADRILVAHGIRRRRAPWIWGIAATVVLAAGIATVAPVAFSGRALAGEALAHVAHEPEFLLKSVRYAPDMLPKELAAQGVRLASSLGEVTFAMPCPVASGTASHIVVATPQGKVTLLLMPGDGNRRRRAEMESDGMTAIALPAARGSIAIVAASRAQALAIENALILS